MKIRNKIKQLLWKCANKCVHILNKAAKKLKCTQLKKYYYGRCLIDIIYFPVDLFRIYNTYNNHFGKYPKIIYSNRFNEKLQYYKLFNRKEKYIQWADKILVRNYVKEKIGKEYLNRIIWIGNDLMLARKIELPKKFVIKINQGSGSNIIVDDISTLNWEKADIQTKEWLKSDHSEYSSEWQYRWINPKILIEEFLEDSNGNVPLDYKFFCFRGIAHMVQIDFDRFKNHTRSFYDREFKILPFGLKYPRNFTNISKPKNFNKMIELAEKLSDGENFIRIDFYDVGKPIFGEITLHPGAGLEQFEPPNYDEIIGRLM